MMIRISVLHRSITRPFVHLTCSQLPDLRSQTLAEQSIDPDMMRPPPGLMATDVTHLRYDHCWFIIMEEACMCLIFSLTVRVWVYA